MSTVLITGASTGIGAATATRLGRNGWTVLAGVRNAAAGEQLVAQSAGADVRPLALDVTNSEQIAQARAAVDDAHAGRLDALVNNAGIGVGGPLELIPPDELRRQFEVNVFGQVAVTQALLPALRRAQGRVLFTSSVGGKVVTPFLAPYAASKFALEAIGDALRVELRSSGIQVALLEPGSVATPIWDKARADGDALSVPPELQREYGHVPAAMLKAMEDTAKRGVPAEDVASTVERALAARRMRPRYVIGRDARVMILARRLLPDQVFDRVISRALGV